MQKSKPLTALLLTATLLTPIACKQNSDTGAAIGAGAGAGGGALIGSAVAGNGKRTQGALIGAGAGALVGGATGYMVGREEDKKVAARQRERDREDRYYTSQPPPPPAQPAYPQPPQPAAPAYPPAPTYPPSPPASPAPAQSAQALTPNDVILWTQQGVQEVIIIDRIQRSGTRFTLTPQDEAQLRNAGVTPAVIQSMKATATR